MSLIGVITSSVQAQALQTIELQSLNGMLTIRTIDMSIHLYFQSGMLIGFTPQGITVPLEDRLLQSGLISASDRDRLHATSIHSYGVNDTSIVSDMDVAFACVEMGILTRSRLYDWYKAETKLFLTSIFTFLHGEVYFDEHVNLPLDRMPFPLQLSSLVPQVFTDHIPCVRVSSSMQSLSAQTSQLAYSKETKLLATSISLKGLPENTTFSVHRPLLVDDMVVPHTPIPSYFMHSSEFTFHNGFPSLGHPVHDHVEISSKVTIVRESTQDIRQVHPRKAYRKTPRSAWRKFFIFMRILCTTIGLLILSAYVFWWLRFNMTYQIIEISIMLIALSNILSHEFMDYFQVTLDILQTNINLKAITTGTSVFLEAIRSKFPGRSNSL
jgi:hypothetical protein